MPGSAEKVLRCFWSVAMLLVSLLILTFPMHSAQAQGFDAETQSDTSSVPCPPGFPASFTDPVFGTFWGYSRLTMVQEDQYHTYKFYTYEFSGKTSDGRTGVKGIHHVNASQCLDAAFAFWAGVPAVIGTMHNSVFTSNDVACNDDGASDMGDGRGEYMESYSCDGGGASGGGGTQDGGSMNCWTIRIDHYWYYPDSGRVEYRYSTTSTWCEQAS